MNNLLYLQEILKKKQIFISFVNEKMYFTISQDKFLEPNWKKSIYEQESLKEIILEMGYIQKVIQTFKIQQNKLTK